MKQTLEAKAQCETCSFSCKLKNIKGTCIEEAAKILNVSKDLIYKILKNKELTYCKIGAALRIEKTEINDYIARSRVLKT